MEEEEDAEDITLDWNSYGGSINALKWKIGASEKKYDIIIAIMRGGVPIGITLSHYLNLPLVILEFRGHNPLLRDCPWDKEDYKNKVLLVDDISDTGLTLKHSIDYLKKLGFNDIDTATLFWKKGTAVMPTYVVNETDAWVSFPYEYKLSES